MNIQQFTAGEVGALVDKTHQTANSLVGQFVELGLLEEVTGFQRNRLFGFIEYLSIFADD